MGAFALTPHKVKLATVAGLALITAETAGFMISEERTAEINSGLVRVGKALGEIVLDDGLERFGCFLISIPPKIGYDGDCIKNAAGWSWDQIRGDEVPAGQSEAPSSPTPTVVPANPDVTVITNPPAFPEYRYDLVADMESNGYVCTNEQVVTAVSGDGAIDLLVRGGTNRDLANTAYENGAVSGLNIMLGESALVGACS